MKIVNAYITLVLLDETGVGRGRVEVQADRTTRAPFERKRMGEKSPTCFSPYHRSSHRSFPILFWLLWYWCAVPEQKKNPSPAAVFLLAIVGEEKNRFHQSRPCIVFVYIHFNRSTIGIIQCSYRMDGRRAIFVWHTFAHGKCGAGNHSDRLSVRWILSNSGKFDQRPGRVGGNDERRTSLCMQ